MSQTTIRLARAGDAYEIGVMSRYLIEAGLHGWSWPPERVLQAIRNCNTNVAVAEAADHLVGFGIMEFGDTRAHLALLAVKPTHQRCGIGRDVLTWLMDAALVAGIESVTLELRANNYAARMFYRSLAFKETTYLPGYYRGVETALRMSRDIRRQIPDSIS
jgi:[ribosomal protein S18]-alanine N-acetyltransferase